MMMNKLANNSAARVPYPILRAACNGDSYAVDAVMNHYDGYINKLATRRLYDEYGHPRMCIDEALKLRLKSKLLEKIMAFKYD